MTQKPDTSAKDESSKREKDRAIAANSRMKKQLAKQRMSMPGMRKPNGSY